MNDEKKYLLIEDDCAPDANEHFWNEMLKKYNLTFIDFKNLEKTDARYPCVKRSVNGYIIELIDTLWHLSKEPVVITSMSKIVKPDSTIDILDVILFTINEKAKDATKSRYSAVDGIKEEFYKGQHQAYSEDYSLIMNIRNNLTK